MKLLLAFALFSSAAALCAESCNGHGKCGDHDKCECYDNWTGPSCKSRVCPFTNSWAGDTGHEYAECGNKGECDRGSGLCKCFDGYTGKGCDRLACVGDGGCNGHGTCEKFGDMNTGYTGWDADKIMVCNCDPGYTGPGCESRMCKPGDDPMTPAGEPHVSEIKIDGGSSLPSGDFYLTFEDWRGVKWDTWALTPTVIETSSGTAPSCSGTSTPATPASCTGTATDGGVACISRALDAASCEPAPGSGCTFTEEVAGPACEFDVDTLTCPAGCITDPGTPSTFASAPIAVEEALEALPNHAIPDVNVTHEVTNLGQVHTWKVTFVSKHNTGDLTGKLSINYAGCTTPGCQPYYTGLGSATAGVTTVAIGGSEAATCSNRGTCDSESGICQCVEGFYGEACEKQTIIL